MEKARETQLRLIAANGAVTARFGIPGLKMALDLPGLYGGPVRPPLRSPAEDHKLELERILREPRILGKN
jgi:4-hydroxy-2-oxoglutarate aldolase